MNPPPTRHQALLRDLLTQAVESPWLEFKHSNADPDAIGRLTSALANGARSADRPFGYIVWGVEDATRRPVGTTFDPQTTRKGNQTFAFWLAQHLDPSPAFEFIEVSHAGSRMVLLQIPAANIGPVRFDGKAYIRIGDATPPLADFPERERLLWTKLQPVIWERGLAAQFLTSDEVLDLIDYTECFRLLSVPLPENRAGILQRLIDERVVRADYDGHWSVTNLGALLFARKLDRFDRIGRKALRVIVYEGNNRIRARREHVDHRGYAVGFNAVVGYIDALLPRNEHIEHALRIERPNFPEIAVRELLANALIHQDLTITGAGPMVEVFDGRVEITNPGQPLVDVRRFIGSAPLSRNDEVAGLMRRMGLCEERGSGLPKAIAAIELYQLPPPSFAVIEGFTRASLFAPQDLSAMGAEERVRACYQHAALLCVTGKRLSNESLRQRLGADDRQAATVSRIIKASLEAGVIKAADPQNVRAGYLPWWG